MAHLGVRLEAGRSGQPPPTPSDARPPARADVKRRIKVISCDAIGRRPVARMEESAECMLVLIGATPEGKKELVGFQTGVRESAQSWRELLIEIKRRGLEIAPDLAVGDGALGFWKAIEEVFPGTKHQRCWVHKTANVLNKVALSVQVNMKADLREIYGASTRAAAESAIDVFADKWRQIREGCHLRDKGPGSSARFLRLPGRALGPSTHVKPDRERVRDSSSSDGAHEGIAVGDDRQVDGVQARHRRRENLAAIKRRKPVAESRSRRQIPEWHRGHRNAGSPRRLIDPVTQSPA
jgi:Transposase, Mutator family